MNKIKQFFGLGENPQNQERSRDSNNFQGPGCVGNSNTSQLGYRSSNSVSMFDQQRTQYLTEALRGKVLWKQNTIITSKKAKRNLDVCQDPDAKGMLIIYEDFNMPNQRFDIYLDGNSVYFLSTPSQKFLTIGANSKKNGAPVFQEPTLGLVSQRFGLLSLGNDEYLIHTFCGKVLDCCKEEVENGTRVVQHDQYEKSSGGSYPKPHQVWIIK